MSRRPFQQTSNPALSQDKLDKLIYSRSERSAQGADVMTINGTIQKTALLLGLVTVAAVATYYLAATSNPLAMPLTFGGMLGAFGLGIFIVYKPEQAPRFSPIYAILEGLFLGGISAFYVAKTGGEDIVTPAIGLTLCTLFTMLAIYRFRIIKVTEKLRSVIVTMMGAIMLYYVLSFVLSFFGIYISPVHQASWLGIGICVAILIVAA